MSGACETCRFWQRGEFYVTERYGSIPARGAWTEVGDSAGTPSQIGDCRIVAPGRTGCEFARTYAFYWCGEYQPTRAPLPPKDTEQ